MRTKRAMGAGHAARANGGFTYVALLLFIVLIATLALTFINRVGLASAAKMSHRQTIQAEYLSRAAANHALFLLLNDPRFPTTEVKYYMHEASTGRYGYKVRRHTETQYATIATIGVMGDVIVKQSYVVCVKPGS